ncbi:MAG TPA: cardiolipin synthase [Thermoanaerobaculia bacterium]|jgi:cardiolipin synthase|nr:cardiolipin synthase [Thermoanaerobaculia bacterium]
MKMKTQHDEEDRFGMWSSRGTTYVRMPLVAFIGGLIALLFLIIMIWSMTREPNTRLHVRDLGELQTLMPSLVGLTQSSLEQGNLVHILQNGDGFFPPLFREIEAAKESIHLESYIWYESTLTTQLSHLLAKKASQGVEVRILVDASGGKDLKGDQLKLLEDAGAHVAHFHPIRISNLGRINNRDHRKLVILDGRVAYTGGYGFADEWTGNGQDKKHYRDTGLRLEGPVVHRLQAAFSENWIEETGEIPADGKFFPHIQPVGTTPAHVAYTSPTGSISSVQILYYLAIKAAKHEIIIQNPYLLPDRAAIDALEEAVDRGVDVKIMVPSDDATDNPIVQHASHHHFGTLLKRGVKIWEYEKTLLHQKVIIIDGLWSSVGSTNFDDRSFQLNDEINVGLLDAQLAAQLRAAFHADLRHARQRSFDEWQDRSLWHKTVDGVAYLGRSQL